MGTPTRDQCTCSDAGAFFVSSPYGRPQGLFCSGHVLRERPRGIGVASGKVTWPVTEIWFSNRTAAASGHPGRTAAAKSGAPARGLEFVDEAHVYVPGILGAVGSVAASSGVVAAPDVRAVVQPQGDVIGFHQKFQVLMEGIAAHDAHFHGPVPVGQVQSVVIGRIEVRPVGTDDVRAAGPLDVAGHAGAVGALIIVDMDGVTQVFEKADVAHTQAQAPGAHQCGSQ